MELREEIARAICGNWVVGDDRPWQQWAEEADAVIEVLAQQKPVYLFRRKGFRDFCTCDKERYEELAQKPMFECKIAYSAPLYLAPVAQSVSEDTHRDAMRYRALRNNQDEYPAVFTHPGADEYGWFPVDGADLDEVTDELLAKGAT